MYIRKEPLLNNHLYHVFTKSIEGYKIFRSDKDYKRMVELMKFYSYHNPYMKFSTYLKLKNKDKAIKKLESKGFVVNIVAYCIMPTHLHLILVQLVDRGISIYMQNLLNSYTRYFNVNNKRKGPLWQGRFKSVLIENDEYLLHLTRYIHLNPTSAGLVDKPEDWKYSSYNEYLGKTDESLCKITPYLEIEPEAYKKFVEERKEEQRSLTILKKLILE